MCGGTFQHTSCKLHFILFAIACLSFSESVKAGVLDNFEEEVGTPKVSNTAATSTKSSNSNNQLNSIKLGSENSDTDCNVFLACLVQVLIDWTTYSYNKSLTESSSFNGTVNEIKEREPGDPIMSVFRLDASRQNLQSDVSAVDYAAEFSHSIFALHYRSTALHEPSAFDDLQIKQLSALIRGADKTFSIAFGVGAATISGQQQNTGPMYTIPVKSRVNSKVIFGFRPTLMRINGRNIQDYDISGEYLWRYAGIRIGYRYIDAGYNSLRGPYIRDISILLSFCLKQPESIKELK